MEWVEENVVIVHYCGKSKPWKADYKGKLGFFYERYSGCLEEENAKKASRNPMFGVA